MPVFCKIIISGFLTCLAIYDYRQHKVRNAALLAFLPLCLFAALGLGLNFCSALSGFLCGGLLLLFAAILTNGGIGGGDIKLAALLGLCCGVGGILFILTAASVLALLGGTCTMLAKKPPCRIAFVPYILAGYLLASLLKII